MMKRSVRRCLAIFSFAVLALSLGALQPAEAQGGCLACAYNNCESGLIQACFDQCGNHFFPDGCTWDPESCPSGWRVACVHIQ